jgi:hypothetical protein
MKPEQSSALYAWMLACVPAACVGALVVVGILGTSASANDRYFNATHKDCSACHRDVTTNYRWLTRYGNAFRNNGCPGVRGGC